MAVTCCSEEATTRTIRRRREGETYYDKPFHIDLAEYRPKWRIETTPASGDLVSLAGRAFTLCSDT